MNRRIWLIACWLMGSVTLVHAEVYKYQDDQGRTYLTDKPMGAGYRLVKRFNFSQKQNPSPANHSPIDNSMQQRRTELQALISSAARDQNLSAALINAVVHAESGFRHDAVSHKGAIGLMQLMPATAEQLGVSNPYDPQQNLSAGSRYLRQLLERFDRDLKLALAAYNAGITAVVEYGYQVPPFPETQAYVAKVLKFYADYRDKKW